MKRILLVSLSLVCSFAVSTAHAQRRPGITAVQSERFLTQARNSLAVIAGPGHLATLGGRYQARTVEGGYQLKTNDLAVEGAPSLERDANQTAYVGVMFGLFEDLEAGALFLSFDMAPEFEFAGVPVFITQSFMLGDVDLGIRLGFLAGDWALDPGIPIAWRIGGGARLDAGVFFPMTFDYGGEFVAGTNAVARFTQNFTPRLYAGLETGISMPSFDNSSVWTLPLGALVGYTLPFGSNVVDIGGQFFWDQFLFNGIAGAETLQIEGFRIQAGITIRKMVL